MRRVLVTGSTGQVGQRLCSMLSAQDFEVVGISKVPSRLSFKQSYSHLSFDLLRDDFETLNRNVRAEFLVHLAWETRPKEFWSSTDNSLWTQRSIELIKSFWRWGGVKTLVAGTCAEYDWRTRMPLIETDLEFPETIYGKAKLDLLNFLRGQGMPFLWTRTFFQFGGSEAHGRLIPSLISSLWNGEKFRIERPEDVRDFIYVDDVAKILASLIATERFGVFNVGSGTGVKVQDLAIRIASMMDRRELLQFGEQIGEPSIVQANISKIQDIVDLLPSKLLDEALRETIMERCLT